MTYDPNCDTETHIFSYQKDEHSEIIFHIGWYADGYIMTQISGPEEGHQTVVLNDEVIGVSYPSSRNGQTIFNKYSWGTVRTSQRNQEVKGLNPGVT